MRAIGVAGSCLYREIRVGLLPSGVYRIRRVAAGLARPETSGWTLGEFMTRARSGVILARRPGGWREYSARLIENWNPQESAALIYHRRCGRCRPRIHCALTFTLNGTPRLRCKFQSEIDSSRLNRGPLCLAPVSPIRSHKRTPPISPLTDFLPLRQRFTPAAAMAEAVPFQG